MIYELAARELVAMQGTRVWIRPDAVAAGRLWLCSEDGKPLAIAEQRRLVEVGATNEHQREAFAKKARVTRLAKAFMPQRDFLLRDKPGQILHARARFAAAEQAEQRRKLAPPPEPEVAIVRADLAEAAEQAARRAAATRRPRRRGASARAGFDALGRRPDGLTEIEAAEREAQQSYWASLSDLNERIGREEAEREIAETEAREKAGSLWSLWGVGDDAPNEERVG